MPPKRPSSKAAAKEAANSTPPPPEDSPLTEQGSDSEDKQPKKKQKRAPAKKTPIPVVPLDAALPINLTVPDPLPPYEKPEKASLRISSFNVAGLRASEKKGTSLQLCWTI
jgi:hypothetical protein